MQTMSFRGSQMAKRFKGLRPITPLPGTPDRIDALAKRAAAQQPLQVDEDSDLDADDSGIRIAGRNRNGKEVIVTGEANLRNDSSGGTEVPHLAENSQKLKKFSTELRLARMRKGWSQTRLGQEAGVTERAIRYLEADQKSPTLRLARVLARLLGFSLDTIR